jgi:hypothetical protein
MKGEGDVKQEKVNRRVLSGEGEAMADGSAPSMSMAVWVPIPTSIAAAASADWRIDQLDRVARVGRDLSVDNIVAGGAFAFPLTVFFGGPKRPAPRLLSLSCARQEKDRKRKKALHQRRTRTD